MEAKSAGAASQFFPATAQQADCLCLHEGGSAERDAI